MSKRSETLKHVTEQALNFADYHLTFESLDVNDDNIDNKPFFNYSHEITDTVEGDDSVIVIRLNKVNISGAVDIKNNIDFNLNVIYVLQDSTVVEVNVELLDIDFIEDEDVKLFIKDFINNSIKYILSGLITLYIDYDELGIDKSGESIKFSDKIQLNFILDKKNNIHPSIKCLFLNDMDILYDIEVKPELVDELDNYSNKLREPVEELVSNEGQMVTELYTFDDGIVQINTDLLQKNYDTLLSKTPETVNELMKHLIVNSIMRSGTATVSNMLALYDDSNFLSVNRIVYSVLLTK